MQTVWIDSVKGTFAKVEAILIKKNQDYGSNSDPFRNLRSSEVIGVPPERAMLIRLLDKLARINNLIDKAPAVKEESLEDAIDDAIGYLALLRAYRDRKNDPPVEHGA